MKLVGVMGQVSKEDLIISKLLWARDSRSELQLRDARNLLSTGYDDEYLNHWAKRQGIERVHGFFVISSPGETKQDVMASFRFAARLKLDTFGFNRLCAYRGTPLWQEYVDRGIIDDELDWDKWFKCSDIDPTALSSAAVNQVRMRGYAWLFACRIFRRPIRTYKLLRTFGRYMKTSDILKLLYSPFRRRTLSRKPDLPARMMELGLKEPPLGTVAIP
jgi:anaerobic magnesium-protoporphyrin IX monomethyl ester cyclase